MEFWHTTFDFHQLLARDSVRKLPGEYAGAKHLGTSISTSGCMKTTGGLQFRCIVWIRHGPMGRIRHCIWGQNAEDLNAGATISRIYTDVLWVMGS